MIARHNRLSNYCVGAACAILLRGTPAIAADTVPTAANAPIKAQADTQTYPHRQFSLAACFNAADTNNKEIAIAKIAQPVAQIVMAGALPNPTYNLTYGFGPAWLYVIAGNNQQFGWTEEIQVAGRRTKKLSVARAAYLQSVFQVEAVRFSVHNRVRRAYAELVAAAAGAELIERQRQIAAELLAVAEKRVAAGKAPGAQAIQARLNVLQFQPQRNQAQGRLVQDAAALAILLGETPSRQEVIDVEASSLLSETPVTSTLVPDPARELPGLEQLLPTAMRNRQDFMASIQQAHVDRKALTLAKTQRVPDPTVGFDYLFSTYKKYQPRYFDPSNTGTNSPGNKVPQQPGYLFTYSQEAPIFTQYRGAVDQAAATWMQQTKQTDLMRSQIATNIVTAYAALQVSRQNIKKYQTELLPAGLKVAQLAHRSYELGKTDLASAVVAQQQYQQVRSSYFDAVSAYQNAWADLEQALGLPLTL